MSRPAVRTVETQVFGRSAAVLCPWLRDARAHLSMLRHSEGDHDAARRRRTVSHTARRYPVGSRAALSCSSTWGISAFSSSHCKVRLVGLVFEQITRKYAAAPLPRDTSSFASRGLRAWWTIDPARTGPCELRRAPSSARKWCWTTMRPCVYPSGVCTICSRCPSRGWSRRTSTSPESGRTVSRYLSGMPPN